MLSKVVLSVLLSELNDRPFAETNAYLSREGRSFLFGRLKEDAEGWATLAEFGLRLFGGEHLDE